MELIIEKLSAKQLIEKYKNHELTITDVVNNYIERIKKHNLAINALVEDNFSEALDEAIKKQSLLSQGKINFEEKPLWGLPFTVKEMIAVKGKKQTLGTLQRSETRSSEDATIVQRIKDLGGILLGTSNVSELGFWFECSNPVYKATKNPHDLTRTSGGSSGGEAALVSMGLSPLGIGSDVGGSLRIPSHFCGAVTHKPSPGVWPLRGHFPVTSEYIDQLKNKYPLMTVIGPICKNVEDLIWILPLLSGANEKDPLSSINSLNWSLSSNQVKKIYILSQPDFFGAYKPEKEVSDTVETVGQYLLALGYEVVPLKSNFLEFTLLSWLHRVEEESVSNFSDLISPQKPFKLIPNLIKKIKGENTHEWPALITSALQSIKQTFFKNSKDHLFAKAYFESKKQELYNLLDDSSVLILPTHPRVAMKLGESLKRPFDFIYTAFVNLFDLPATQIPIKKCPKTNLPIGIQIVSGIYKDKQALELAQVLETGFSYKNDL